MKNRKIVILVVAFVALATVAYAFCVGYLGGNPYSNSPDAWGNFSSYINNLASPLLAFVAAMAALRSMDAQRQQSNASAEMGNCLQHIEITRGIIEKGWRSLKSLSHKDWEGVPSHEINPNNFPAEIGSSSAVIDEVLSLGKTFQSLSDGAQWYAWVHKKQIEPISNESHPKNEWASFSTSVLLEQSKKMKFCHEYIKWVSASHPIAEKNRKEILVQLGFYDQLVASKIIQ